MSGGAGEVEADDQVVVGPIAAAIRVFPAPGVQAVIPQMPDGLAVHHLVGLREAQVAIAVGLFGELYGDKAARVALTYPPLPELALAATAITTPARGHLLVR